MTRRVNPSKKPKETKKSKVTKPKVEEANFYRWVRNAEDILDDDLKEQVCDAKDRLRCEAKILINEMMVVDAIFHPFYKKVVKETAKQTAILVLEALNCAAMALVNIRTSSEWQGVKERILG